MSRISPSSRSTDLRRELALGPRHGSGRLVRNAALLTALALGSVGSPAHAQVTVGPVVVHLAEPERFATFTVENRSPIAQEVTLEFRFGYPASDSLGNLRMVYDDSATAARFSMASWARAFPRRFLLGPGQRQLVRLTVRPPQDLANRVYWTRLVTGSLPRSPPVDSVASGVTTQINIRLEQVTTVLYSRGRAETALEVGPVTVRHDSSEVRLFVGLKRTGAAPFLGSVALRVTDSRGVPIHEAAEVTSVYFEATKRFALPRARLKPGRYTAEVRAVAERADIPPDVLFRMAPVALRTEFVVP
jgi:hypothetical protein